MTSATLESVEREYRIDDLAREAGVASTTVRLYQNKGLLPPPRLEGRTGWYSSHHLARLRLIARLQNEGFSLAGIGRVLEEWEQGRSLDAIVGVEAQLDALLGDRHSVVLDAAELIERFPEGSMTPELVQRAAGLGLVELTDDGRFRLPDRRFVETGASLAHLGVPLDVVLDEWDALVAHTDDMAQRFIGLFEEHLLPNGWQDDLESERTDELAHVLAKLQVIAHEVTAASLDSSLARAGRDRMQQVLPGLFPPTRDDTVAR
jgi:DNA-binding transcriptional MerR regulator